MEYPGFCGGDYQSQAITADAEQTINLYTERLESPGATARVALYPTPGVELVLDTFSRGIGRAHWFQDGREFAVIGPDFVEIPETGTFTSRGAVAVDSNPATISSNGDGGGELFITSGGNGYLYNLSTNTLSAIAALAGKATMGGFMDGYFLALDANTSTFYISDLLDGATWDPTQFAQRTTSADPWIAMRIVGKYVWLLGEKTSEVWYDAGTSPFPFAAHPSGLVPYGIAAPFSCAVADGTLLWLGASDIGDGYVLKASGFNAEVVSDFALQTALERYGTIEDAEGFSYTEMGHTFYVLSFPFESKTWVLDLKSGQWHQRGTWISEDNEFIAWRPRWHAKAFGEHRILDAGSGKVYRMSVDLATDVDDREIRRVRRAPCLTAENELIFYRSFELFLQAGLGLVSGQGSNPLVMIRFSKDGGRTWGAELTRSAGEIGQFLRRVRVEQVGAARQLVVEVSFSDPVPWRITGAGITLAQIPESLRQRRSA